MRLKWVVHPRAFLSSCNTHPDLVVLPLFRHWSASLKSYARLCGKTHRRRQQSSVCWEFYGGWSGSTGGAILSITKMMGRRQKSASSLLPGETRHEQPVRPSVAVAIVAVTAIISALLSRHGLKFFLSDRASDETSSTRQTTGTVGCHPLRVQCRIQQTSGDRTPSSEARVPIESNRVLLQNLCSVRYSALCLPVARALHSRYLSLLCLGVRLARPEHMCARGSRN